MALDYFRLRFLTISRGSIQESEKTWGARYINLGSLITSKANSWNDKEIIIHGVVGSLRND